MTLAMRCWLSRLRDALRRGSVVRVTVAVLSIAATAMIVTSVTPGVAAANQTDWSAPQNVDGTNRLVSTSCASPLFCVGRRPLRQCAYIQRLVVVGARHDHR